MFLSYHPNAGQNENITNKQPRNVANFKCFETSGKQRHIYGEVKHIKLAVAVNNLKIKVCRIIILPKTMSQGKNMH